MLSVLDDAILMSKHNMHFHDKIRQQIPKISLRIFFLDYRKNFVGTQKRIQISHGKRYIGVRVTEVLQYIQ